MPPLAQTAKPLELLLSQASPDVPAADCECAYRLPDHSCSGAAEASPVQRLEPLAPAERLEQAELRPARAPTVGFECPVRSLD